MLGKTFKGMTDVHARLADRSGSPNWPTAPRTAAVVKLRPEQVVEIAVRRSAGFDAGIPAVRLCRFARVLRYRDDKSPAEADTIDTVQAFYERGS